MGTIKIKRGLKRNLPSSASLGEPLYCTDTNQLYIGKGNGNPLELVSDYKMVTDLVGDVDEVNSVVGKISTVLTNYVFLVEGEDKQNGDWSEALRVAIDNVKDGGKVLIPSGVFNVCTLCDFEVDWVSRRKNRHFTIEGNGTTSVLKVKDGSDYALCINHPVSLGLINGTISGFLEEGIIKLKNFAIDCNNSKSGLIIKSSLGIKVEDVNIYNLNSETLDYKSGGVYIDGAGGYTFDRLVIRGSGNSINININEGAGDGSIINSHLTGGYANVAFIDSTGNQKLFNNLFQVSHHSNIFIEGNMNDNSKINIFGNMFETSEGCSISAHLDGSKEFNDSFIHDNIFWIHGSSEVNGILLGNSRRNEIYSNKFMPIHGGLKGVGIKSLGNYNKISDNTFNDISGGTGIILGSDNTELSYNKVLEGTENSCFISILDGAVAPILENNRILSKFKGKGLSLQNKNQIFKNYNNDLGQNQDISPNGKLCSMSELLKVPTSILMREVVRSDGDYNSLLDSGYYYIQGTTLNSPSLADNKYGLLLVLNHNEYITQIFYSNDGKNFRRVSTNSGSSWSSWFQF